MKIDLVVMCKHVRTDCILRTQGDETYCPEGKVCGKVMLFFL